MTDFDSQRVDKENLDTQSVSPNRADAKQKKKEGRIKTDVIVMVLVLLLIAGYIFFEAYNATHVEVETVTAVTSTVFETIDARALVIRQEHIVDTNSSGITVPCVEDGGKVKVNGNLAMLFSSDEQARRYTSAQRLQQELDYYISLESKAVGTATDVATIDKDIIDDVNSYIRQADNYSPSKLENSALQLNDKLTRRQMIIGQEVDISSVKASLQEELNKLDLSNCSPKGYVTTEESGVFSSFTDGLEDELDYKNIDELDIKTFDKYMKQAERAKATDSMGKLITAYEWYFCCKVCANDIKEIKDGDVLDVALKNSDQVISCQVVSGATVDLGVEETILVLRSSQMNSSIASMRVEDIEIRFNQYEGFRLPTSAIHIDENGDKLVYALVANQVKARSSEIVYSTKDYVIMKYEPDKERTIRLYDQIITQGKDLHDGKIYT